MDLIISREILNWVSRGVMWTPSIIMGRRARRRDVEQGTEQRVDRSNFWVAVIIFGITRYDDILVKFIWAHGIWPI